MIRPHITKAAFLFTALACLFSFEARAAFIINGGFETGFTGWTTAQQTGSEGMFGLQTGTASPITGEVVPPPPGGSTAAMTDAEGPGSRVLYQSFTVSGPVSAGVLVFDLFVGNRSPNFFTSDTLDFSRVFLNQQARVDILRDGADPFSILAADVLMNAFQTNEGDQFALVYAHYMVDIASLLNSNVGNTLTLRFAQVDNVSPFQLGVDNVDIQAAISGVPEPSYWIITLGALLGISYARRRTRASRV